MRYRLITILAAFLAMAFNAVAVNAVVLTTQGGMYQKVTSVNQLSSNDIVVMVSHSSKNGTDKVRVMTTADTSGSHTGMYESMEYSDYDGALPDVITLDDVNGVGQPSEFVVKDYSIGSNANYTDDFYLKAYSGNYLVTDFSNNKSPKSLAENTKRKWNYYYTGGGDIELVSYNNNHRMICDNWQSPNDIDNGYFYNISKSNNNNLVYLYRKLETVRFTVSSVGYSTLYYSNRNITLPEGLTAATCALDGTRITYSHQFNAGDVIPKNTAVIVKGIPDSTHTLLLDDNVVPPISEDNMLGGFDEDNTTIGGGKFFKLSYGPNGVGFYYAAEGGAAFISKGHMAYLCVPESLASKAIHFVLPDENTSVDRVGMQDEQDKLDRQDNANVYYDLSGRRVHNPTNGIYIHNHKIIKASR